MKPVLLVPAALLLCASHALASAEFHVQATQPHAAFPASIPVAPTELSGQGYGTFTTPGLQAGSVAAHLYDQHGTRQFMLLGTAKAGKDGAPGVVQGALLAPGTQLDVEGTWEMLPSGAAVLVAFVYGPPEDGGAAPLIGRIVGFIALPVLESLAELPAIEPASRQGIAQRRALQLRMAAQDVIDIIDPALNGVTGELELRWMLVE